MDRNSNKKQENITIRSLITDFFNENLIILQPNFQRQIKRSAAEMNKIIETYVREDCIPNLFIIEKKHIDKNNNEHVLYECLDGQHRLTALKHYITNKPFNNEYLSYESKNGEYVFFDLTDKIKSKFNKLKIFCRQMSSAEKTLFLNTKIQITFISDVKDQHYLENNEFKKLQDGAKIDKTDLIKNSDHPISNFLKINNLTRKETLNKLWNKIFKLPGINDKNEYKISPYRTELSYILIKSLILLKTKDFDYIDRDNKLIADDIITKSKFYLFDVENTYKNFLIIKQNIENIFQENNIKKLKYTNYKLFLILLHMYDNNTVQIIEKIINNIDFEKKYTKKYSQEYEIIENMICKFDKKNV